MDLPIHPHEQSEQHGKSQRGSDQQHGDEGGRLVVVGLCELRIHVQHDVQQQTERA